MNIKVFKRSDPKGWRGRVVAQGSTFIGVRIHNIYTLYVKKLNKLNQNNYEIDKLKKEIKALKKKNKKLKKKNKELKKQNEELSNSKTNKFSKLFKKL